MIKIRTLPEQVRIFFVGGGGGGGGGGEKQKKFLGRTENLGSFGKQQTNIILILA